MVERGLQGQRRAHQHDRTDLFGVFVGVKQRQYAAEAMAEEHGAMEVVRAAQTVDVVQCLVEGVARCRVQTASLAASIVDKHAKTVIGQRLRGDGFKSGGVIAGSAMQEDERHTVSLSESLHIEGLRMPFDRNAENQQG